MGMIKMDLRETGLGCSGWIPPDHNRDLWSDLLNMIIGLQIP
jgi:hypothetical protein